MSAIAITKGTYTTRKKPPRRAATGGASQQGDRKKLRQSAPPPKLSDLTLARILEKLSVDPGRIVSAAGPQLWGQVVAAAEVPGATSGPPLPVLLMRSMLRADDEAAACKLLRICEAADLLAPAQLLLAHLAAQGPKFPAPAQAKELRKTMVWAGRRLFKAGLAGELVELLNACPKTLKSGIIAARCALQQPLLDLDTSAQVLAGLKDSVLRAAMTTTFRAAANSPLLAHRFCWIARLVGEMHEHSTTKYRYGPVAGCIAQMFHAALAELKNQQPPGQMTAIETIVRSLPAELADSANAKAYADALHEAACKSLQYKTGILFPQGGSDTLSKAVSFEKVKEGLLAYLRTAASLGEFYSFIAADLAFQVIGKWGSEAVAGLAGCLPPGWEHHLQGQPGLIDLFCLKHAADAERETPLPSTDSPRWASEITLRTHSLLVKFMDCDKRYRDADDDTAQKFARPAAMRLIEALGVHIDPGSGRPVLRVSLQPGDDAAYRKRLITYMKLAGMCGEPYLSHAGAVFAAAVAQAREELTESRFMNFVFAMGEPGVPRLDSMLGPHENDLQGLLRHAAGLTETAQHFVGGLSVATFGKWLREAGLMKAGDEFTLLMHRKMGKLDFKNAIAFFFILGGTREDADALRRIVTLIPEPRHFAVDLADQLASAGNQRAKPATAQAAARLLPLLFDILFSLPHGLKVQDLQHAIEGLGHPPGTPIGKAIQAVCLAMQGKNRAQAEDILKQNIDLQRKEPEFVAAALRRCEWNL